MPSKLLATILALAVPGIVACGSSGNSSTSSHSVSAARKASRIRTYHAKLTGAAETPAGAPRGAGTAVIALHGRAQQVCWRFAHLRGFTGATFAHIHRGVKGTAGPIVVPLSTAAKLHHKGCVHTNAAEIKAIEADPHGYYVNIHSKVYPGGAVRSQL